MAEEKVDTTLNLPRILCLHGGGTNARIFRMQCRTLQRALRPFFRLVFAEAPLPSEPGPDVTSTYQDYGPFKAWFPVDLDDPLVDASSTLRGIDNSFAAARLDDNERGATGDWVALLGFSQGAKLAASIVYTQQETRHKTLSVVRADYRFVVLFAGRGPLVWVQASVPSPHRLTDPTQSTISSAENSRLLQLSRVERRLRVPTIHIHGLDDPNLELHRSLFRTYCDLETSRLIEWPGEHRMPIKAKDIRPIMEQIIFTAQELYVLPKQHFEKQKFVSEHGGDREYQRNFVLGIHEQKYWNFGL